MTSSMSDRKHRVIVDPQFAIELRDISDFLGEFGPTNGRYVPRYPADWSARLKRHIDDLSIHALKPVKRQEILERIRRDIPLCSVPVAWPWDVAKSWASNIEGNQIADAETIVIGEAADPTPFLAWDEALDDIRQLRKRTWSLHGTVAEYVEHCRPLLLNSPTAYLVDPYLDPFSNMIENLLRSLFDEAKGSKCYSIELITRQKSCGSSTRPPWDDSILSHTEISVLLKKIYQNILPKDRSLKLHLVNDMVIDTSSNKLRMHDRFFLTRYGGVSFGQGYELVKPGNTKLPKNNAFVIDKDHLLPLQQTYIDGVARHTENLPKISGISYPIEVTSFVIQPDV